MTGRGTGEPGGKGSDGRHGRGKSRGASALADGGLGRGVGQDDRSGEVFRVRRQWCWIGSCSPSPRLFPAGVPSPEGSGATIRDWAVRGLGVVMGRWEDDISRLLRGVFQLLQEMKRTSNGWSRGLSEQMRRPPSIDGHGSGRAAGFEGTGEANANGRGARRRGRLCHRSAGRGRYRKRRYLQK